MHAGVIAGMLVLGEQLPTSHHMKVIMMLLVSYEGGPLPAAARNKHGHLTVAQHARANLPCLGWLSAGTPAVPGTYHGGASTYCLAVHSVMHV